MQFMEKMHESRKSVLRKIKILNSKINKHLNSFHALHSPVKMDRLDLTFKFSTELIVASLSLLVIAANAVFGAHFASANTPFAKLLSYHPSTNLALYTKQTTIKTIVAQDGNPIIPSASAQVVLAATDVQQADLQTSDTGTGTIDNNTITKQDPGSIKQLVADQIKVYDTQPGDTLQSVAQKFGISENTIIWANNLPNSTIKPGWNLVILPTSGVVHTVTNNDTLPDIAKKYNADINKIISYNGLQDEQDINPGDVLIIPDGTVPAPKPQAPAAKPVSHSIGKGAVVYEPAPGDASSGGHIFPWGQCTYYVATRRTIPWGGNANQWLANARAYGYSTGRVPTVGSIMVTNESRRYGHVAYVEHVYSNGTFEVSEMNYVRKGVVDHRTLSLDDAAIKGFIY